MRVYDTSNVFFFFSFKCKFGDPSRVNLDRLLTDDSFSIRGWGLVLEHSMALLNRGMKLDASSTAKLDPKRCKSCEIRLCDVHMYCTGTLYQHQVYRVLYPYLCIHPCADEEVFNLSTHLHDLV